jgi:hypothetical protein
MTVNRDAIVLFTDPFNSQYGLGKPWIENEIMYVTDARAAVMFEATGIPDTPPSDLRRPNIKGLFGNIQEPSTWINLPSDREMDLYTTAASDGPCPFCLSYGRVPWNVLVPLSEDCEVCQGSGCLNNGPVSVRIQNKLFSRHYIEKIRILAPECEIGIVDEMLCFRFEGGSGCLMSLSEK